MTQNEFANALGTSQSAVNRIENGGQNVSLEMLARIGEVLSVKSCRSTRAATTWEVNGGQNYTVQSGEDKQNAVVALLCASLLNRGTTTCAA